MAFSPPLFMHISLGCLYIKEGPWWEKVVDAADADTRWCQESVINHQGCLSLNPNFQTQKSSFPKISTHESGDGHMAILSGGIGRFAESQSAGATGASITRSFNNGKTN